MLQRNKCKMINEKERKKERKNKLKKENYLNL